MILRFQQRIGAGYLLIVALVSIMLFSAEILADHDTFGTGDEKYQSGKKVFSDYCSRCHGIHANGQGRATHLYVSLGRPRPSNFTVKFYSIRPSQYLESVVREGGEKHSLSKFMPPFGAELSKGQINNVVYFIQSVSTNTAAKFESKSQGSAGNTVK